MIMCKHIPYNPTTFRKCAHCLNEKEKATTIKNLNKIKAEIAQEEAAAAEIEKSDSVYAKDRAERYREAYVKPLKELLERHSLV